MLFCNVHKVPHQSGTALHGVTSPVCGHCGHQSHNYAAADSAASASTAGAKLACRHACTCTLCV